MGLASTACEDTRATASNQTYQFALKVAALAAGVADRAHDKLGTIMREDDAKPEPSVFCPQEPQPKYFEDLRDTLNRIQSSLYSIDRCLERTEF